VNSLREIDGATALGLDELVAQGLVEYIDFPAALVGKYQCYTQADMTRLRAVGCDHAFADVATGVRDYMRWLEATE
jgi:ADP-L-glycero-D-manno-heptose 6-epimerase